VEADKGDQTEVEKSKQFKVKDTMHVKDEVV